MFTVQFFQVNMQGVSFGIYIYVSDHHPHVLYIYTYTINDNHAISEILLMMLAQRLIKQDRNLVSWMHSELNYPQVSLVYYMINLNLLTIKSCSVIHVWWFNFSFQCIFFFGSSLWVEQSNNITSKAVSDYLQGQVHEVADRTRYRYT